MLSEKDWVTYNPVDSIICIYKTTNASVVFNTTE